MALGFAVVLLLVLAPGAVAAPPANDDFADATELTGPLPIDEPATNVEATKEEGEPFIAFGAGHTVWYEWTAADTGFVTIGACEREIETVLGVFTGDAVNVLTKVVDGNADEGPHCPFGQREYTFKAVTGTTYKIAVDGSGFFFPEGPKPVTEGEFTLRIEATPLPANDDFADAEPFSSSLEEEFEGKAFYWGSIFGYNWNATEEVGEPDHVGGPHGASVWYSWTAPASGEARISLGFFSGLRIGVYRGSGLGVLDLLLGGLGPIGSASFTAIAGTTYKVAVYGLLDGSSSEPQMNSFQFNVSMQVPVTGARSDRGTALPPPPDTTPPDTRLSKRMLKGVPATWIFSFGSNEPGSTFQCKLDKRPFVKCRSPKTVKGLKLGNHTLKVRAVDPSGNVDKSPALARFTVGPPAPRRGRR